MDIHIFRYKHKVEVSSKNMEDETNIGETDFLSNTLFINPDKTEQEKKEALIHEILENINYRMELKLSHEKITQLGMAILCIVEENSEVLNKLWKQLEDKK